MIRVVVADDQALVRGGFRLILDAQPDIEVVGEAANGHEAIDQAHRLHPDVVLMDIRMPQLDGLEATRRLMGDPHPPRVLVLTTFDLDEYVYDALRSGASGFLLKDVRPEQLADAVRTVASGDILLAPTITRHLVEQYVRRPPPGARTPTSLQGLTDREIDVLRLVGGGRSNQQIAEQLFLGETTVKTHLTHIFTKLGLHDRAQAVVLAYESGLIEPGGDGT
jgi:DNA-binding NarL/FixJ family response regulator